MNVKRTAPYLAAHHLALAGMHTGFFLFSGGLARDIVAVLMYHSIEADLPWAISAAVFRKQMQYVKKQFRVVPFGELRAECERSDGKGRILSVTFDDGRLDNYVHALPVLEDVGVKATFFVTSGSIGGIFRTERYQTPMMDERQLRELVSLGHEVGAHTVTHPPLTRIPRSVACAEMHDSKRRLEDLLGMPVWTIAYPYGDYNREVRDSAAELGFTSACIVKNRLVPPQTDWLLVPRVSIDHTLGSGLYFKAKVSHAVEVYERLRGTPPGPPAYLPAHIVSKMTDGESSPQPEDQR